MRRWLVTWVLALVAGGITALTERSPPEEAKAPAFDEVERPGVVAFDGGSWTWTTFDTDGSGVLGDAWLHHGVRLEAPGSAWMESVPFPGSSDSGGAGVAVRGDVLDFRFLEMEVGGDVQALAIDVAEARAGHTRLLAYDRHGTLVDVDRAGGDGIARLTASSRSGIVWARLVDQGGGVVIDDLRVRRVQDLRGFYSRRHGEYD